MNDQQQSRADALTDEHIATLKLAARAVTPQDIDGAERIESRPDGSYITCPACEGEGCIPFESDYCNYDHVAIGVQFYGVGTEPGAAEAYFRAAKPATILALLDRLERAESALAASPVSQPALLTAQDALAAIETFEIVGDNNDSREPNAEDRFILTEFVAHLFGGFRVELPAAAPADERAAFDILAHLQRQREFSERTFGPGARTAGVCDHIRKELKEIEANPGDLTEWIDVVILALDGAWRAGGSPQQIIDAIVAKQTKNEGRTWPDWRTVPADKAIEHDRSQDACQQCHGKGAVVFRDPEDAFDVTCGVCSGSGQARAAASPAAEAVALTDEGIIQLFEEKADVDLEVYHGIAASTVLSFARALLAAPQPAQAASPAAERVTDALQALSADVHTLGDGWANDEAMIGLAKKYLRVEPKPASPELSLWRDFVLLAVTDTAPQPAQADAPAEARADALALLMERDAWKNAMQGLCREWFATPDAAAAHLRARLHPECHAPAEARESLNEVLFGNDEALEMAADALDRLGQDSAAAGVRAVAYELRMLATKRSAPANTTEAREPMANYVVPPVTLLEQQKRTIAERHFKGAPDVCRALQCIDDACAEMLSRVPADAGEATEPVCWIERDQLANLQDLTSDAWVYWRETGHVAEADEVALYAAPPASRVASLMKFIQELIADDYWSESKAVRARALLNGDDQ
ncbi:dATP/dGTP pyrophosphohydrolase domain-containing protein [Burkholderia pseudomallei]|uniref:dATP/dGTP pyrophosphohydrolase domain-containing protein n=1 Tax=Burkholderia pseudomallei TaxID=28450 RepID=UPI00065A8670|nr:dATP/dGTP pyrophosphohydrolase domain-containing protein [Burkholderia pseudomallei]CRY35164.1 gp43 [Burkholderia pseudomallei]